MFYAQRGDKVIISRPLDPYLEKYRGCHGTVEKIRMDREPPSVLIRLDNGDEAHFYNLDIDVLPPSGSVFEYDEEVRVLKDFGSTSHHICKIRLVGQKGKIKAFDKRDSCFKVKTPEEEGWFPATVLQPINFLGDYFYLPGETVKYNDQVIRIAAIKKTQHGWGQLLLLANEWVPGSLVAPLTCPK